MSYTTISLYTGYSTGKQYNNASDGPIREMIWTILTRKAIRNWDDLGLAKGTYFIR